MKRCSICGQEFPATAEYFTRKRDSKDGLHSWCKPCHQQKQKEWRHADPERYIEYARQAYLRHTDTIKARAKRWTQSESGKRSRRAALARNIKVKKQRDRIYYQQNRDRILSHVLERARQNPDKMRVIRQRRAARVAALPVDFTDADWQFAINYFKGCCAACGRPPGLWHTLAADHWIALASNGCPGTIPSNIVPLCHGEGGCNNAKQSRDPLEWLEAQFGIKKAQAVNNRIQEFFSLARHLT